MRKILVPVDGSDASSRAVQMAISILKSIPDGELHIVTVQAPIVSRNVSRFFAPEVLNEYYQDEGKAALAPAMELATQSGVKFQHSVLTGSVAETIEEYVQLHHCDHIIMGSRGLGAVPGLILGSVTTKVLSLVSVPVTLIK
ncbi:universal stress protein [Paenalcaligenes suwonensis]|uniref:universal stress protein n=1 Tax=Paenalcaligenes suwonensis TaxID=1202713 RepID=UPI00140CF6A8|nr:universal stress protein [Paenalcaligenes suwonensis]NHC62242.1 universal stress protein [Paenalcaligenes suwonensis]